MLETLGLTAAALGSFILVALASKAIGQFFSRYGLPYITGYLLAGMVAGPFVLGLMQTEDTVTLRFIDELSLAVIAFIAGSELYLKELRSRLRPILLNVGGVLAVAPILIGIAIFVATQFIPFTADLPVASKLAVAILGATILLALSPASTIAVIQEVRARGDFTRTTLSVTVVMDVVIIVLFAVTAALAAALLQDTGISISFALALVIDLTLAVVIGLLAGKMLEIVLSADAPRFIKTGIVLLLGLGIFVAAFEFTAWTKSLGFELHMEPLLICMIAGFYMTNFTRYRDQFDAILHDVAPAVYVAFFTLTGVALKLDILIATGGVAIALFLVRMFSIYIGSYAGGTLAGEPPKFRRNAWMGLITQAGIALGLAREVAVQFPALGDAFATLIISVVVLNEIFGPLFLKVALRRVGEAHEPETAQPDEIRDAVIFGLETQSVALARELEGHGWKVTLADTDPEHVSRFQSNGLTVKHVDCVGMKSLQHLMAKGTDAVVAMMDDDDCNLEAVTTAYENFGVKRLVVRLSDVSRTPEFTAIGATVINTGEAVLNLMDQSVRAPQSAALLMHTDPDYDVTQVTITNRDIHGMLVRDLRLPDDVLILELTRNGHSLVPNGYTTIHHHDEITLVGSPSSLKEVTLHLGF